MTTETRASIPARQNFHLADMSPAYFGLVMSTGIVSLAAWLVGYPGIASPLFALNIVQFMLLAVLYGARAWRYPRRFLADLVSHRTGPGYFTLVAGSGIMASQFLILKENTAAGVAFWVVATVLWAVLTYTFFMAVIVRRDKPTIEHGIDGSWLLSVVAAQALAVSSALLSARLDRS